MNNITDGNIINSNNESGISLGGYLSVITGNIVRFNTYISNVRYGVHLHYSRVNKTLKNNILDYRRQAYFAGDSRNLWLLNYWNRPRILPKLIFGIIELGNFTIPWFNIDWRPALKPYDI